MDEQFRQYRFARTEGQKITEAELAAQFKDGIQDLDQLEHAIETTPDQAGCLLAHHRSGARRFPRGHPRRRPGVLLE
ncbi:MAG TPA: hypothetical protein VI636_01275 [Candidatus Angelobacter sp.]